MPAGKPESSAFRHDIERIMALLPDGKVTTYGDIAALAGHPYAARVVGGIAHYGNPELPWHRLVNRQGGLAKGYPGGMESQRLHLEEDGITCTDYVIDAFKELHWKPQE